jgi:tetrahydromethanopterin S-methyltransferase subunit F
MRSQTVMPNKDAMSLADVLVAILKIVNRIDERTDEIQRTVNDIRKAEQLPKCNASCGSDS